MPSEPFVSNVLRVTDQVTQSAYLERRSTIQNDNGIVAPAVPGVFDTGVAIRGKFFPRGCRGKIEEIQLYCIGNGADEITLRYSPHPSIGPYGETTMAPVAVWGWQFFRIREMWNYDSLFIWVHECGANVSYAYDFVLPHDAHSTLDGGATWYGFPRRYFIRMVYDGETIGDIPVSGTINTVEIPSVALRLEAAVSVLVPDNTITQIVEQEGTGTLVEAFLEFRTADAPTPGARAAGVIYIIVIYIDGVLAYAIENRALTQSDVATSGRCAVGEFWQMDTVDPQVFRRTVMSARLPLKFRRSISLHAIQTTGGNVEVDGGLHVNLNR